MSLQISLPSKTFLLGEYLVLLGGPALILNTAPRFVLSAKEKKLKHPQITEEFHPQSPAGKFLASHANFFQKFQLKFFDPYHGQGGLGASSAQYCALAVLQKICQQQKIHFLNLLKNYRELTTADQVYKPSGADVIAQLNGGVTFFQPETKVISRLTWPFPDIYFALLHTKNKVDTAAALREFRPAIDICKLNEIVLAGYKSLQEKNAKQFCNAINAYGKALAASDLVTAKTAALIADLQKHPEILAAKGCGALSADILLVLIKKNNKAFVENWAQQKKLNIVAMDNYASDGLSVDSEMKKDFTEKIIAVDRDDNQLDIVEKLPAHQQGILHRAFSVFIFRRNNGQLQLLLQQRAKDKYHSGSLWTNTCCSHSQPGLDTKQSAVRRLREEMGITAELFAAGCFTYKAKLDKGLIEHEYDHVFVGLSQNATLKPNKHEVSDYRWINIATLKKELEQQPGKFTPWLKPALELILDSKVVSKLQ